MARCTAKARTTGDQCRQTAIDGGTVCHYHGGAAPRVKASAAKRAQQAKAAEAARLFAIPKDIDPSDALVDLVKWTAGEVDYWRREVERIATVTPEKLTAGVTKIERGTRDRADVDMRTIETVPHIAYRMLTDAQDRLAKYASAALRAGVEERRVKLAEDQGALVAQAIRGMLADLNLTPEQTSRSGEVVARHLRLLTAG